MKASFTILGLWVLLSAAETSEQQKALLGGNVILRCEVSSSSIRAVEWTRTDLKDEYVFFYRDGRSDPTYQHGSFKDRVQLVYGDGNVSLRLMNVTNKDAGMYECRVALSGSTRSKRAIIKEKPITTIRLTVEDTSSSDGTPERGNDPRGYLGSVVAGVAVVAVLVLCIAGFFHLRYKRAAAEKSKPPAAASETVEVPLV